MTPGCRCTDDVAYPEENFDAYYLSDSSYGNSDYVSEIFISGLENGMETFDPADIDYFSERAQRPTIEKSKKYKEAFCDDADMFINKNSHTSSSCESDNKKKKTTITSTSYMTTLNDLSEIIDDDRQVEVHLRQVTPVTDVFDESLAEGGIAAFTGEVNFLLVGTISIGLVLLVTAAVLYVKCVINKDEDKTEKRVLSKEEDNSRHEGDVFACQ